MPPNLHLDVFSEGSQTLPTRKTEINEDSTMLKMMPTHNYILKNVSNLLQSLNIDLAKKKL